MKKKQESIVIGVILAGSVMCSAYVLSGLERIPHVYSYSGDVNQDVIELAEAEPSDEDDNLKEENEVTSSEGYEDNNENNNPDDNITDESDNKSNVIKHSTVNTSDTDAPVDNKPGNVKNDNNNGDNNVLTESDSAASTTPEFTVNLEKTNVQENITEKNDNKEPLTTLPPAPTAKPTSTPVPDKKDEVVRIVCQWDDKDSVIYKSEINSEDIVVKAIHKSGKETVLSSNDFFITGLNTDSIGVHTMSVIYKEFECEMDYTVISAEDRLVYEWSTKDKCYKNEEIDDSVLTVTVYNADGSCYEIDSDEYTLSGIDNTNVTEEQVFTIEYMNLSVQGICRFYDRTFTYINEFYDGSELIKSDTKDEEYDVHEGELIEKTEEGDGQVIMDGKTYQLTQESLTVDGRNKSLPYYIPERAFDVKLRKVYTLISDN